MGNWNINGLSFLKIMEAPWDFHGCDRGFKKKLKCGNQVQIWLKEPKTMSNSGENYKCFYICFFLDILKLC
jgi:hypothetical protein